MLDEEDNCVLVQGARPLPNDDSCSSGEDYWYERTAYRKIYYSSCEGGTRLDHGRAHACPGLKGHGFFFWLFVLFVPASLAGLIGYWIFRRNGLARGYAAMLDARSNHLTSFSEQFGYLAATMRFVIRTLGSWKRSRQCRGLSSASRASRGSSYGQSVCRSVRACDRGRATERSPWMKTRRSSALKMRIRLPFARFAYLLVIYMYKIPTSELTASFAISACFRFSDNSQPLLDPFTGRHQRYMSAKTGHDLRNRRQWLIESPYETCSITHYGGWSTKTRSNVHRGESCDAAETGRG